MRFKRLWLADFRNYVCLDLEFPPGISLFVGSNGEGKTNLLEAIFYLATMTSFRVGGSEALVRSADGAAEAIARGEVVTDKREILLEAAVRSGGRSQFQMNRQRVRRRDLLGVVPISVFMPDDLVLLKGAPSDRRRFLDDALSQIDPRLDAVRSELESVLRQRNALLRQIGGRLNGDAASTLDVWDQKLAEAGDALAAARRELVARLQPRALQAYWDIAAREVHLGLDYASSWAAQEGLGEALARARQEDLRRAATTVGPHRDDLLVWIEGRPARTHASQGEQRSLALSLRLAVHRELAAAAGQTPLLLLDDVFSELDPDRSRGVLLALQSEQTLLTTAGALPPEIDYNARFRVAGGRVVREV